MENDKTINKAHQQGHRVEGDKTGRCVLAFPVEYSVNIKGILDHRFSLRTGPVVKRSIYQLNV